MPNQTKSTDIDTAIHNFYNGAWLDGSDNSDQKEARRTQRLKQALHKFISDEIIGTNPECGFHGTNYNSTSCIACGVIIFWLKNLDQQRQRLNKAFGVEK